MNTGILVLVIALIVAGAMAVVHKTHHRKGGCIHNCEKCQNPCHHKGR